MSADSCKMAAVTRTIIARSFSSSSITQQLVKPPVQLFGVNGRYATALFSAGSKQKSLDSIEKDLIKLEGLMKTDTKFADFVKDPTIKRSLKVEALKSIGQKASMNSATTNLLALLAENGRLKQINEIINSYKIIMAASRGEVLCEVITASSMDSDTKSKLESVLKSLVSKGENILLITKVDPSIIGGMIVSVGDKYVDMSISSKIKKYSEIISTPI